MNNPPRRLIQYRSVMLFTLAMIIYGFSACLTTDPIQPVIVNIINELQAYITLAATSVSLSMAGGLALAFGNVPMITWVAFSATIPIEHGVLYPAGYIWMQIPVLTELIIASAIVANVTKDATSPRLIWRTIQIPPPRTADSVSKPPFLAARLVQVGAVNEHLCARHWFALSGAVPLHTLSHHPHFAHRTL